jgi:hypothetical protein
MAVRSMSLPARDSFLFILIQLAIKSVIYMLIVIMTEKT